MSPHIFGILISLIVILGVLKLEIVRDGTPVIQLPNGIIRGRKARTIGGRPFWAYQKIPFAAPPVGPLRFKPPVPPENWDGVLKTMEHDVICYQVPSDSPLESEDCLYLNVYTPSYPDWNSSLPVMFYIYGGGFVEGNCLDHIYGPEFLLDNDVIVVAANYRVGPFGFLSTQDMMVPGNNGLKDQLFALQWTHKNIHLFGGDPNKITIFGQSAGSASVTYHLLHTKSEGLFRGAICESGSFLSPWAFQRKAREYAFKTASYINPEFATSNDSQALLNFLQTVSADEIDRASHLLALTENHQNRQILQGFFYAPVIEPDHEGAFLTEKMFVLLNRGEFIKVPTLMGFNSEENVFYAYLPEWLKGAMTSYDENLDWLVPDGMGIEDLEERRRKGSEIRDVYTGGRPLAEVPIPSVRYYSDTSYTRPIRKQAEIQSRYSDVYFYQFSYDGKLGNFSFTAEGLENITHGEDNKYIWRMYDPYYDNTNLRVFPFSDQIVQRRIQKMWTNFAKYLNPTPIRSPLLQFLQWPKVGEQFAYVDILENFEVKTDPKNETYQGWLRVFEGLGHEDFDTY